MTGGAGAVVAAVLLAAATAWACTSAGGAWLNDMPTRNAVGATAEVRGGGWLASSPVQIGWQTTQAAEPQPLATAQTDGGGAFSVPVRVPDASAGLHYLAATQGSVVRLMPFEIGDRAVAPVAGGSALSGPAAAAAGRAWDGLRPAGAAQPDGAEPASPSGASLPVMAVTTLGALTLAGTAVVGVRRRRVQVGTSR